MKYHYGFVGEAGAGEEVQIKTKKGWGDRNGDCRGELEETGRLSWVGPCRAGGWV